MLTPRGAWHTVNLKQQKMFLWPCVRRIGILIDCTQLVISCMLPHNMNETALVPEQDSAELPLHLKKNVDRATIIQDSNSQITKRMKWLACTATGPVAPTSVDKIMHAPKQSTQMHAPAWAEHEHAAPQDHAPMQHCCGCGAGLHSQKQQSHAGRAWS